MEPLPEFPWLRIVFSLICGDCPVLSIAFGEESTNADLNFKTATLASDGGAGACSAALVIDTRSRGTAERHGCGRKRSTVRDRVLLQSEVGPRGRISNAFQEE